MPSPFPGMNPYLEQADSWRDFHHRFITHAGDWLSGQVGENYLVKLEVRLYLHELSDEERHYFGDADAAVAISSPPASAASSATATLTPPVRLRLPAVEVVR